MRVLGFGIWCLGLRGLGFRVQASGFGVFRVLEFRVHALGFGVQGSGFSRDVYVKYTY